MYDIICKQDLVEILRGTLIRVKVIRVVTL